MSRIFEDQDAKALIVISALIAGLAIMVGIAAPKHHAPSAVATANSAASNTQ
jgi:hypothetical protein